MLFLPAIMLFLGGFIPLILAKGFLKSHNTIYVIGWIAWFVGVAIKSFITLFVTLFAPWLVATGSLQFYIYAIIIETTEVISAYVFLKYHPAMKRLNLHDIIAFGAGFGIGEALTLAWIMFLPIDFAFEGMLSTMAMFERFSAVLIHIVSIAFIGLYLKKKKNSDLIGGIVSKDLSAATLGLPVVFSMLGFTIEGVTYLTELVIGIYALSWIWILYMRFRSVKIPAPAEKADIGLKRIAVPFIFYLVAYYIYSMLIQALVTAESIIPLLFGFIGFMTAITVLFYHFMKKRIRRTEIMLGGFLGAGTYLVIQNYIGALADPSFYLVAGLSLLSNYMYAFMGILIGLWFYEIIIKRKLKLPHT